MWQRFLHHRETRSPFCDSGRPYEDSPSHSGRDEAGCTATGGGDEVPPRTWHRPRVSGHLSGFIGHRGGGINNFEVHWPFGKLKLAFNYSTVKHSKIVIQYIWNVCSDVQIHKGFFKKKPKPKHFGIIFKEMHTDI